MKSAFLAFGVAMLVAGGAPVAAAQEQPPWTVATAANDFGTDRPNFSYTANAGDQLQDGLVVSNSGSTPLELVVYSADAFTTESGGVDLVTRDVRSTGVGAWVRPAVDHVTVPPGASADVPFTLTVPADAATGDHLGGIVTSVQEGDAERRVGIRIKLRVGGDLKPGLAVEDLNVDYSGAAFGAGDATVTYTLHNTGNAIVAARQAVSVSGPFGSWQTAAAPVADSPQLLPGEKWRVSAPVAGVVPALELTGTVTLTPLLTDAAGSTLPLAESVSTTHGWAIPWAWLAVLVFVVLVVVLVVVLLLVRRRKATVPASAPRERETAGT